jgi:hypothetical protein
MRSHAVNTERQVYRLRKSEVIKVLYQGTGEAVIAGNAPLEGAWFRVLTGDGTQGWCFSHYLQFFDFDDKKQGLVDSAVPALYEAELAPVFSKRWYPEDYLAMIVSGTIDLEKMQGEYGFALDRKAGTVTLKVQDMEGAYSFTNIDVGDGGSFTLEGSPIIITPRDADSLTVSYISGRGIPVSYNFVALEEPLENIIQRESARRKALYDKLTALGPELVSDTYGTLRLNGDNQIQWINYEALVPAVIPYEALSLGTVEFRYYLSDRIRTLYDGVITIRLAGSPRGNNFFYRAVPPGGNEEPGLYLENAGSPPPGNIFSVRSLNP